MGVAGEDSDCDASVSMSSLDGDGPTCSALFFFLVLMETRCSSEGPQASHAQRTKGGTIDVAEYDELGSI